MQGSGRSHQAHWLYLPFGVWPQVLSGDLCILLGGRLHRLADSIHLLPSLYLWSQ